MKISYLLYKIFPLLGRQVDFVLPRKCWERVSIVENDEPLMEYDGTRVRTTVSQKLGQVKTNLPPGVYLKVLDGYRSLPDQQKAWDKKWNAVKSEHSDWNDTQIDQEVGLVVARPKGITNHLCGGAVDVVLVDAEGKFLDFGTTYAPTDEASRKKCPMFARDLTDKQKNNRKILRKAMGSAGFVWYPGEWWHYCYGDRMWAVYTNRRECFYGPVELKERRSM